MDLQERMTAAVAHHQASRLVEAESIYREVLSRDPNHANALHNLGVIAGQTGHNDAAVEFFKRAIQLQPDFADAHSNLGNALLKQGQLEESIAACERAIQLNPDSADAHNNLANALVSGGRFAEAIPACQRAIQLQPDFAEAYNNLGNALLDARRLDEAIAACRRAIRIRPDFFEAFNNLGNVLMETNQFDEAIKYYEKARQLQPGFAQVHYNIAVWLQETQPTLGPAIDAYEKLIAASPNFAMAHWSLGCVRLLLGDFARGLPECEWRLKKKTFAEPRNFRQPAWDGGDLAGKRILLHTEQGLGDTIHMARYIPMVAASGATVILKCQPELLCLLKNLPGVSQILAAGDPLPAFDVQCALMSLPLVFKTTLETIPAPIPYLHAETQLADEWSKRFPPDRNIKRIGVAWAGKPTHKNDHNRSMRLDQFAPLTGWKNAKFFSLQKGPAAEQSRHPPAGMEWIDFTNDLHDFTDTAAMIANLDLIVTVDSSVAHLAGAMGKPVWLLLPFMPDWRWMLQREDSPWYPTMRLFRQKTRGDWNDVMERMQSL